MNATSVLSASVYADCVIAAFAPESYDNEDSVRFVTALVVDRIANSVGAEHVRPGAVESMVRARFRLAMSQHCARPRHASCEPPANMNPCRGK